jgi:uncharacterized NAD-dependent epimerase/dehydratase family protein
MQEVRILNMTDPREGKMQVKQEVGEKTKFTSVVVFGTPTACG